MIITKEMDLRNYTGPPVTGDDFFGRAKELKKMGELLKKGMSIFIPGPRRIGKTSLAMEFMRQNKEIYRFIYFDLEGKRSIVEFCEDSFPHVFTVPYDNNVHEAQKRGVPISQYAPTAKAALVYKDISAVIEKWNK